MKIETTGFKFTKVEEFATFSQKAPQKLMLFFFEQHKDILTIIPNPKTYYVYNEKSKLWGDYCKDEFISYAYEWWDKTRDSALIVLDAYKKQLFDQLKVQSLVDKATKDLTQTVDYFGSSHLVDEIMKRITGQSIDRSLPQKLDRDKSFLPIKDGKKINLRTREITDRTSNDTFTIELKVTLVDKTPNADKFFESIFPVKEHREYFQKWLGYCITGETHLQKIMIAHGVGSNGKSASYDTLRLIMKDFYATCAKEVFIQKPNSTIGSATPYLMDLKKPRIAVYSEGRSSDDMQFDESQLKMISGEDQIKGRKLHKDNEEFMTQCKLNMTTNFTPRLSGDHPMKRRIIYSFFTQKFVENPTKENEQKLDPEFIKDIQTKYLDEVFSWMVQGAVEYYKNPTIEMPKDWEQKMNDLTMSEDAISSFLEKYVTFDPSYKEFYSRPYLFDGFVDYCKKNSQRIEPRSVFYDRLRAEGAIHHKVHVDGFRGIKCTYDINEEYNFVDELESGIEKEDKTKELQRQIEKLENENKELKRRIDIKQLEKLEETIIRHKRPVKEKFTDIIDRLDNQMKKTKSEYDHILLEQDILSSRNETEESGDIELDNEDQDKIFSMLNLFD